MPKQKQFYNNYRAIQTTLLQWFLKNKTKQKQDWVFWHGLNKRDDKTWNDVLAWFSTFPRWKKGWEVIILHHVRTLMNNLDGMTEILWFSCGKRKKSRADLHSTAVVNYETNNKRSGKKDVRTLLEISCGYMFITLFLQNFCVFFSWG